MTGEIPLGPGGEFDVVRALVARFGAAARGVGDDAGVLDLPAGETILISTDSSVEDVHFRRGWLNPEEIGYRAATAALSDLAAMAATPRAMVVALTLPAAWRRDAEAIADGLARAAGACGAHIVGGDVSDGPALSLTVTVVGSSPAPLSRTGARAGDAIWVTGSLGGPSLALRAFESGSAPPPAARERFACPRARVVDALWLARHGATAAIDISDGLASDLGHIAAASGVRIVLELDSVPVFPGASVHDAAAGGEEYELAIAGPADLDPDAFARASGNSLKRVGMVEAGEPGVVVVQNGLPVAIPRGYDHFST